MLKFCFLWIFILLLLFVIIHGVNFLLPIIKNILKLSTISIADVKPQTIFDTVLKNTNFAIVYITVLFTVMGITITFMSAWWHISLKKLEKCYQDYEGFRKKSALEAQLTTAKTYFTQGEFAEAWEIIKSLPDDLNYEIPLYKARILIHKTPSVFLTVMSFFDKALLFPKLTNETKALIYRYIATAYREKRDYKKALEYAEKAINENRIYWTAHNEKAMALKRLGRMDEAIKTLEKIIEEDRSFIYAYYNLACYYSLKSLKKPQLKSIAITYYKEAIKLNLRWKKFAKTDSDLDNIRNEIENL